MIQSHPVVREDELGLISDYGLRYLYTEPASVLPLGSNDAVVLHRSLPDTAEEIARFCPRDARRLVEMVGDWQQSLKFAHQRWNAGGALDDVAGAAGYESLRRQSAREVVHRNFEHDLTRRV